MLLTNILLVFCVHCLNEAVVGYRAQSSPTGVRTKNATCQVTVTNKNGVFLLQVTYDSGEGEVTEGLAYGISSQFVAVEESTVKLHVVLGGSILRRLTARQCQKGMVYVDCTGPTIWNFQCTQPYN